MSFDSFGIFIESMLLGIFVLEGEEMMICLVNMVYVELVGRFVFQLMGKGFYEVFLEVKVVVEFILMGVYCFGEFFYGYEFFVQLFWNGGYEEVYFDFVYYLICDILGNIMGIVVVCYEVINSVLVKLDLQESECQFRNFVMQLLIVMIIFRGKDLVIEIVNKVLLEEIW